MASRFQKATLVASISALLAGVALWPQTAHAQSDVNPPLANVLILLDSSGSMERMTDGSYPKRDDGTAMVNGSVDTVAKNRWITAVEVIAGSVDQYKLLAEDRSSADFKNEFGLGGADPYD